MEGGIHCIKNENNLKNTDFSSEMMNSDFLVVQWLRILLAMHRHGFNLWSGKIPDAAEQARAPQLLSP